MLITHYYVSAFLATLLKTDSPIQPTTLLILIYVSSSWTGLVLYILVISLFLRSPSPTRWSSMQSNRPSLQTGQPRVGLPSSPACTRLKRDAPFVEGHSRNKSQPIVFTPTRPLRPHRPSVSAPTSAVHVARVSIRSGPRAIGVTLGSRTKAPAGSRESSTSAGSESSASSFSFQGRMNSQVSSSTSLEDYFEPPKKSSGPDKLLQTDPDQHEGSQFTVSYLTVLFML
jgi:hypothetical protein